MKRTLSMTFLLLSILLVIGCYGQPTILEVEQTPEVEQAPYERYSDFVITDSIELYEYTKQVGAIIEYYETKACDDESLIAIDDGFLQDSVPNSVLDFEQLDTSLKDLDFLTSCEMALVPCAPVGTQQTAIVVRPENERMDIPAPQDAFGEPPRIAIGIEDRSFSAKASAFISNLGRDPEVQEPSECLSYDLASIISSQRIIQEYYGEDLEKALGVIKPLHTRFQAIFPKTDDDRFECQLVHESLSLAVSEIGVFTNLYLHYLQAEGLLYDSELTEIARKAIPYIYPTNDEAFQSSASDYPYLVVPRSISLADKSIMTREDEYYRLLLHPQVKLDPDQQQTLYEAMVCGEKSEEDVERLSIALLRLEFTDQDEELRFLSGGMDTSEAREILLNALSYGPGSGGGAGEQSPESAGSAADTLDEFIERTLAAHAACKARGFTSSFNCDAIIMDAARALHKSPILTANSSDEAEEEEKTFLDEVYDTVLQFFDSGETGESSGETGESSVNRDDLTDGFSEEGKKLLEQLNENDKNVDMFIEALTVAELYLEGFGTGPEDAVPKLFQTDPSAPHAQFYMGHGARQADLISTHLIRNSPKGVEREYFEGLEKWYLSIGK